MPKDRTPTRIQKKNRAAIMDAALEVFSAQGFRGATVDEIASLSGLSKPNLLYYFASKEAIYLALLERQLDTWLAPLHDLDPDGEPLEQLLGYVRRKLEMSRDFPRESRLFAHEIIQGAPRIGPVLSRDLKVMDASAVSLARENDIPILVFSLRDKGAFADVVCGRGACTVISAGEENSG